MKIRQQQHLVYIMKPLCNKPRITNIPAKGKMAKSYSKKNSKKQRRAEYFRELLNRPLPKKKKKTTPVITEEGKMLPLPATSEEITPEGLKPSIEKVNNHKANGDDGITGEMPTIQPTMTF